MTWEGTDISRSDSRGGAGSEEGPQTVASASGGPRIELKNQRKGLHKLKDDQKGHFVLTELGSRKKPRDPLGTSVQ